MLGVLPGAARFYSRPSDRCGTFKGPSFPLPRPALFFPVWCWGARQGPQVRSSQHNASKTCRDTHFFLSLLFVGCSPSVWPLVSSFFFCFFLLQIIFLASAFAGCSREGRVSCVVFFRLCTRISASSPFRAGGVPSLPFPSSLGCGGFYCVTACFAFSPPLGKHEQPRELAHCLQRRSLSAFISPFISSPILLTFSRSSTSICFPPVAVGGAVEKESSSSSRRVDEGSLTG